MKHGSPCINCAKFSHSPGHTRGELAVLSQSFMHATLKNCNELGYDAHLVLANFLA